LISIRDNKFNLEQERSFTLFKFCRILPVLALCFFCYLVSNASAEKIPQTYGDAMRWYEKAAKGGNTKAQFLLAYMHETGKGRPYNHTLAVKWYIRAAEKNHSRAQFRLGMLYSRDSSKTTDFKKAAIWYEKASKNGLAQASFNLGVFFERGIGVKKDLSKAKELYFSASKKGVAAAQFNLGLLLAASSKEDRQALIQAWLWLSRAKIQNFPNAKVVLGNVTKQLTTLELKEAQKKLLPAQNQ